MLTVMKKSLKRSVQGVQNVYTQHQPYLAQQLEQLLKGTLSEVHYPHLTEPPATAKKRAPVEVVVVLLGGVTYEEARTVGEMNAANPGVKIVLTGTTVHNCGSFLEELATLSGTTARPAAPAAGGPSFASLANLAPPNVDRKRIAALTSTVTSTVQSGVNNAMSKLQ